MKFTDEHIENYILGRLNRLDRQEFDQAIKTDNDLSRRFILQKTIISSLSNVEEDQKISDTISLAASDYFQQQQGSTTQVKKTRRIRIIPILTALAACLIGIMIVFWVTRPSQINGSELFAENFEAAPMIEFDRSNDGVIENSDLNEFLSVYQNGQFDEAYQLIEQNNLTVDALPKILNYAASAALSKNTPDYIKARGFYLRILNADQNIYMPAAKWNLALMHIRSDEFDEAKLLLKEIINSPQNKYTSKAQNLLRKL